MAKGDREGTSDCHRGGISLSLLLPHPLHAAPAASLFLEPLAAFPARVPLWAQTSFLQVSTWPACSLSFRSHLRSRHLPNNFPVPPPKVAPGTPGVLLVLGSAFWEPVSWCTHFVEMN